ncbi:MAG: hypothetical protein JWL71_2560 [Acidobacteria bacterium]|nr:hypothetical protein [Acidobacteriota bacterium]
MVPAAIVLTAATTITAQTPPDIDTLLAQVSDRIADYYKRAQSVVCLEKTTVQPIGSGFSPVGFARTTESELRVEPDLDSDGDGGATSAKVVRQIVRINGKPPREKDKNDRAGCTDPNPLSTEPLAFLLPANREGYTFTTGGLGKGKDRDAFIIDFKAASEDREGKVVEDARGIEGCFNISVPAPTKGRIWVDARSYQVLRLERHLAGLGEVQASFSQQRKHNLPHYMTMERYDTAIRFRPVTFTDPEESMLLPEMIETIVVWRSGMESTRRRQEYSEYRRFLTAGRIVK